MYAGFKFGGLYDYMGKRFGEGIESPSYVARLDKNELMVKILLYELPFLGHSYDLRDRIISGDPHTFVRVWWDYGLLAALIFITINIISFLYLARNLWL